MTNSIKLVSTGLTSEQILAKLQLLGRLDNSLFMIVTANTRSGPTPVIDPYMVLEDEPSLEAMRSLKYPDGMEIPIDILRLLSADGLVTPLEFKLLQLHALTVFALVSGNCVKGANDAVGLKHKNFVLAQQTLTDAIKADYPALSILTLEQPIRKLNVLAKSFYLSHYELLSNVRKCALECLFKPFHKDMDEMRDKRLAMIDAADPCRTHQNSGVEILNVAIAPHIS